MYPRARDFILTIPGWAPDLVLSSFPWSAQPLDFPTTHIPPPCSVRLSADSTVETLDRSCLFLLLLHGITLFRYITRWHDGQALLRNEMLTQHILLTHFSFAYALLSMQCLTRCLSSSNSSFVLFVLCPPFQGLFTCFTLSNVSCVLSVLHPSFQGIFTCFTCSSSCFAHIIALPALYWSLTLTLVLCLC